EDEVIYWTRGAASSSVCSTPLFYGTMLWVGESNLMAFSVEQLADLIELMGPSPKSGHRSKESRRARRVRHKTQLAIVPCGVDGPAGTAITIQTEDLSLRGVRMIHSAAMESGDEFLLLLPRK